MPSVTPRQVHRWGIRVLAVSVPITAAWPAARVIGGGDAALLMMGFLLALGVTMVAAVVVPLAACHTQTASAFAAGVRVGQRHPVPADPPSLHVVE